MLREIAPSHLINTHSHIQSYKFIVFKFTITTSILQVHISENIDTHSRISFFDIFKDLYFKSPISQTSKSAIF
uniref:Uncharacterized protein n=1 Tax=Octopus bimaculoides TaxID=37653 RepID=A0A0L8HVG1_OCTBM